MSGLVGRVQAGVWRRMLLGYRDALTDPEPAYQRTVQLVQVTYAVWAYFALASLRRAEGWIAQPPADLLWPNVWMTALPWTLAVLSVVGLFVLGSLAAAFVPRSVMARVAAFVGILTAEALKYAYDKINHSFHLWALAAFLLIFLPRGDEDDEGYRRSYLEIAWGIQATILATYTLSGLQKLWGAAQDFMEDGHTVFSLDSLALHVAKVELRGSGEGALAPFIIERPAIGGVLMIGALALEVLALTVLFRPRAQRVFAVGFIAMHVGIGLVMDVWFDAQVLVVAVWLIGTPFVLGRQSAFATIYELPWIGPLMASRIASRATNGTVTVYRDPDQWDDESVPASVATADVAELGLRQHVSYAVRHDLGDASILVTGRRAPLWADLHDGESTRSPFGLLLPTLLLPPLDVPARHDPRAASDRG